MSDFKAPSQTPLGELTALPQTLIAVFKGPTSKGTYGVERGKVKGRRRKGKDMEGEGKREGLRDRCVTLIAIT